MTFLFAVLGILTLLFGIYKTLGIGHDKDGDFAINLNFPVGLPIIIAALFLFVLSSSFVVVDAGTIGVVTRFGNPIGQIKPGIHIVRPIADSVVPVSVQTRIIKPAESAASLDQQVVHFEITEAYHVDPDYATSVYINLSNNPDQVIAPATLEAIKATAAKYDIKGLLVNRPAVRDNIETLVKASMIQYHLQIDSLAITDFSFSKEYEDSIEAKVVAEQNAEKAKNDLTRIQIQAEQQIAQAKGEAEALRAQKEQITPELLQLRTIEMMKDKWDGQLPSVVVTGQGGALPMMDVLNAARAAHR